MSRTMKNKDLYNIHEIPVFADGTLGLRVIADVHGQIEPFRTLVRTAREKKLHTVQLGDLIDRGPDSPAVIMEAHKMVTDGHGTVVRSNHDWKMGRHLRGNKVNLGRHQVETVRQIEACPDALRIAVAIETIDREAPYFVKSGCLLFAHAAIHGSSLRGEVSGAAHAQSIYGTHEGIGDDGFPKRTYLWHDEVPAGHIAIVGHSVISTEKPVAMKTSSGGYAIYLDTGSGFEGCTVSHIDFTWKEASKFALAEQKVLSTCQVFEAEGLALIERAVQEKRDEQDEKQG